MGRLVKRMLNFKSLIQGIVWSAAMLAVNIAYADESSIKEYFNEKEAVNVEVKVKTSKPVLVKKAPNSKEKKSDSKTSLQNSNKKDKRKKIKRPKTHYGIGYEYRRAMREQIQRVERIARPERIERPERPERLERPERINRPDRIMRPERPGR